MILVVDDHQETREVLVRLLRHEGHSVTGLKSGNAALHFLKSNLPDLMLLDYSMPEMDGLTVLQNIRLDPRFDGMPVVMFSALDGEAIARAFAAGATGYVIKGLESWGLLQGEIARLGIAK